jgi:glycosyltransferase involved in cell wall biosynthesis
MTAVLYISYDGVLEPLGESQIVSYIERLAVDHGITLLSFEKPGDLADRGRVAAMAGRLDAVGIAWVPLRYHKRPPVLSTVFDVLNGIVHARRACRARGIQVVHARSYVPSLVALAARGASGAAFLFDMRGFWVDEKVEAGHWARGSLLYRVGKWWERRFFREADAIVSLTNAGVAALPEIGCQPRADALVKVIPTCVDLERFTPGEKDPALTAALGLAGTIVFGCVGTMSNWYMRAEMLRFLAQLAQSAAMVRILIVTREDHDLLRRDAVAAGVPEAQLVITTAVFADMPRFTRLFDAGVFFIRPSLSKRASAATKLAEFLACGIPVVINDGVGDSGTIVTEGGAGLVLPALDEATFAQALPQVQAMVGDTDQARRCRHVAADLFDLGRGVGIYRSLYRQLAVVFPRRGPTTY